MNSAMYVHIWRYSNLIQVKDGIHEGWDLGNDNPPLFNISLPSLRFAMVTSLGI